MMRAIFRITILALTLTVAVQYGQAPPSRGSDRQAQEKAQETKEKKQVDQPGVVDPPEIKPPVGAGTGVSAPVDPKTYKIGPEDVLMIRVWNEPQLTGPVQVRPDGKFTMPLVGDIEAGGLTPAELQTKVVEALSVQMVKPEVMVAVQQVLSKKYFITGEMMRTGVFPLVVPITVMEAISAAGGFREFANRKKITIVRGKERLKFNYNDVIKGKNLEQNVYLENGDYIIVP